MNKEFFWTDALVIEYGLQVKSKIDIEKDMEAFKASKISIPENGYKIISYYNEQDGVHMATVNCDDCTIHSVMRSNGEVFTVKDRVDAKQAGIKVIKKFFIDDYGLWVQFNEGRGCNDGCLGLNSIEKLKPLFTTYDGIEIFDKNELLYVVEHARDVFLFESKSTAGSIRGILKYFYYKEPAEQYVIIHKPCLSISEVIDAGPAHDIDPVLKNNLLKLVKIKVDGKQSTSLPE